MPQSGWIVDHYEKRNGQRPVADFLDALSDEEYKRMDTQIERLEEHGPALDRPHVGYLRDKIWELRARTRRTQLRILFFRVGNRFVLSHGFRKRSGRVRDSEIKEAVGHRNDYLAR